MYPCRICLIKPEIQINIFDIYRDKYNLQEIIYELSQIELHTDDQLPIYICEQCSDKLVDYHLFRQKLLDSKTNLEQDKLADLDNKIESIFTATPETQIEVFVNDFSMEIQNEDDKDGSWNDNIGDSDNDNNDSDNGDTYDNTDNDSVFNLNQADLVGNSYDCNICGALSEDRISFVTHLSTNHSEIYESKVHINEKLANELTCQWCLQQYTNSSNYHRHIRAVHDFKGKFRIKNCVGTKSNIVNNLVYRDIIWKSDQSENTLIKNKIDEKLAKKLICQWCHRKFTHSSNYHRHIRTIHGFTEKFSIKEHYVTKPTSSLECEHCHAKFGRLSSMVRHLKIIHGLSKFPSKESNSSDLNEDMSLKSDDDEQNEGNDENDENDEKADASQKKYKCATCLQEFKFSSNYNRHLKSYHGLVSDIKTQDLLNLADDPIKKFICEVCDQPFCKRELFIKHFHRNHITISRDDLDERYAKICKCQWCWKQFTNSSNFYRHLRIVHGITYETRWRRSVFPKSDKRYNCDKCDESYINRHAFLNHFKRAHMLDDSNSDYLFCRICVKYFSTRSNFRKHIRTFHNVDSINCSMPQNLRLTCEKCNCNFENRSSFIQHIVEHHAVAGDNGAGLCSESSEELVCPICAKRSTTRSNFRRHLRHVHSLDEEVSLIVKSANSDARKYICEKCNRKFGKRQDFLKHFYQNHLTIDKDLLNNLSGDEPTCPGCSKSFSSQNRLTRHLEFYHGLNVKNKGNERNTEQKKLDYKTKKDKGLECAMCTNKVYSSMSNLRRHLYDAHCMFDDVFDAKATVANVMEDGAVEPVPEKIDLKCAVCEKKMSSTSNLYRHLRSIHGLSQAFHFLSDAQRAEVRDKGGSIEEYCLQQLYEGPKKFNCEKCDKTFEDSKKYLNHFQYNHMRIGEESFKKCPYCVKTFIFTKTGAYATLQRHIQKYHKKESEQITQETAADDLVQCPECDQQFIEIFDMYRHFKIHDKDNRDNEEGYNFDCETCKITLNSFNEYFDHKRTTHNIVDKELIKPIKCNWCGERFRKLGGFQLHLRSTHHQNKLQYSEDGHRNRGSESKSRLCPLCGKLFSSSASLSGHMETHRKEEIFQCSMCPKKFRTNNSLNSHLKVHKAERKYQCHICSKGFKTRAHLKRHFFVHGIGVVYHECQICGKKFNRDSNLRIHMWVHREGYPYNCSFCGKGFARKNKMNAHIESEHQAADQNIPSSSQT